MSVYHGITEQNGTQARAEALAKYEQLARDHKEYRRVVADVAKAPNHKAEIDALLSWLYTLTHDVIHHVIDDNTGELARYDHDTVHPKTYRYHWNAPKEKGLHNTDYAGSLDEEGASQEYGAPIYGTKFVDLYDEVIQNVAYTHYNIKRMYHAPTTVIPISACDDYTETDEDTEKPSTWEIDKQTYDTWYQNETERNA